MEKPIKWAMKSILLARGPCPEVTRISGRHSTKASRGGKDQGIGKEDRKPLGMRSSVVFGFESRDIEVLRRNMRTSRYRQNHREVERGPLRRPQVLVWFVVGT
jgi:predicted ATPase